MDVQRSCLSTREHIADQPFKDPSRDGNESGVSRRGLEKAVEVHLSHGGYGEADVALLLKAFLGSHYRQASTTVMGFQNCFTYLMSPRKDETDYISVIGGIDP